MAAAPIKVGEAIRGRRDPRTGGRSAPGAARPGADSSVQPHPARHRSRRAVRVQRRNRHQRTDREIAHGRRLRRGQRRQHPPGDAGIRRGPTRSARWPAASSVCWRARTNTPSTFAPWAASSSHELRTPLTIVRSSLDNLESEGVRADQRGFVIRAREGVCAPAIHPERPGGRGPGRREHQAGRAGQFRFVRAPSRGRCRLSRRLPARPGSSSMRPPMPVPSARRAGPHCSDARQAGRECRGFLSCRPARSRVRLARAASNYELSVANDGPPIPEALIGRLFESLFEHRGGRDDRPHFGLGLYIVRLIAEFHGGSALAANWNGGGGAIFTVVLPMI